MAGICQFSSKPEETEGCPKPIFYYSRNGVLEAVRLGKWKLRLSRQSSNQQRTTFNSELYDLEMDIGEQYNVAGQFPDIVKQLHTILVDFDLNLNKDARPIGRLN